jgi:signal transduction histidine kinase
VLLILPWITGGGADRGTLEAPLDASLRVPFGATFLTHQETALEPGDLVVGVSLPETRGWLSPAHRLSLRHSLEWVPPGSRVGLRVKRADHFFTTDTVVGSPVAWRHTAREWPIALLGITYLFFALSIVLGSRHPVAFPIFHATFWPGVGLLSLLDLVLPPEPQGLASWELRARMGSLAVCMVPASFMHLSMRFPVVARRSRLRSFALLPYGLWLVLAALAQSRLHDADVVKLIEGFAIATAVASAVALLLISSLSLRRMAPIEQARARALAVGLACGGVGPLWLALGGTVSGGLDTFLLLGAASFPVALGWAIVRYRLLDPPLWLRELLLSGISALAGLVLALAVASAGVRPGPPAEGFSPSEAVAFALATVVLYHAFRALIDRGTRRRAMRSRRLDDLLDEAIRSLTHAGSPALVLELACSLIRRRLDASAVEALLLSEPPAVRESALARSGLELWRAAAVTGQRVIKASARHEDPNPGRAEVVLVLEPRSGPSALVAIASRTDALPYAEEDVRALDGLALTTTTALGSAANTVELERRVEDKTAWIERSLLDRARVLETARAICEANRPRAVLEEVERFLSPWTESIVWRASPPSASSSRTLVSKPSGVASSDRFIVATVRDPLRASELAPQLDTVCTFAGLALARLELLRELEAKVEKQASEIASIRTRRLHAEFVRGVAHELRKPTHEVYELATSLVEHVPPDGGDKLQRIRAVTAEMSRRLGLLLYHSGLRPDRRRMDLGHVLADALAQARAIHPDREYGFTQRQGARLPLVADPSRLLSVVENLLDNAIKATGPSGRIAVRSWLEPGDVGSPGGSWVCFEVEDDGVGISPDQLEQIFEPGVSFSNGGFGLGLALCREIVQSHKGMIEVESGSGTTIFRVRLPQFLEIADSGSKS